LQPSESTPQQRRNALIAIACATMIQVIGQLLIKRGTAELGPSPTLVQTAMGMVTILPLFLGYACYGLFTVIMVFALRHGELSMLYPIMALSYVWVTIVSILFLHEPVNAAEMLGVAVIVGGVAVLGRGEAGRS
jgi:drug/metabolite transporter (DMT)-like permease